MDLRDDLSDANPEDLRDLIRRGLVVRRGGRYQLTEPGREVLERIQYVASEPGPPRISYVGERRPDGCEVWRIENDRRTRLDPSRSQKIFNHSPDGFEWGYGGSGPAQLALALMLDVLNDDERAVEFHQSFKWKIVTRMAFERWELSLESIFATIEEIEAERK